MDTVGPEERSRIMSRVRSKDTKPELLVRRLAHAMGYRFRLHRADLPGRPDLVFPARGKVVFIHGCFWHGHPGCPNARRPKSREEFWSPKLDGNRRRDARNLRRLRCAGWGAMVIWECQLKNPDRLRARLRRFLGPPGGGIGGATKSESPAEAGEGIRPPRPS